MKTIIELITDEIKNVFTECGYDEAYAKVTVSNRPDLCEFQCNGAMAAAKAYKKAPFMIADEVVAKLTDNKMFSKIESVKPGFININICEDYLAGYLNEMSETEKFGYFNADKEKTVIVDYGGANAAKPLHVGHLRSAVIGESVKRINTFAGNKTIGDVHLGDWGLQMGLIIEELRDRKPELPYFDDSFTGDAAAVNFYAFLCHSFIRQLLQSLRKMLHLQKELMKLHLSYRAVTRHAVQYGIIL